ncbi:LOW QUALITY PROTEIN: long-chain-alcohol oxidase FAO4A-like [Dioscorea cayenensis subsp. rotundata]|uniref:Long-chain-alcohol oxidase n=1 Tax=Dioscorea cayennensis subsp. rotundata TaxID=55577 RepID=A0AB40B413_DIOCR|nr:LOW QUALITY PROTEIN: long-chain-alcohol oxidase FAO4A-like [Dioscorea cayenensis subsp. rotundata]
MDVAKMPNRLSTDEMSVDLEAALRFSNGVSQAPPVNKLTAREMESLIAISDTFLPSIQLNSANYSTSLQTFFSTSASMLGTPEVVGVYLSGKLQHVMLGLLRLGLWLLSTWYGTLILCGYKSMSSRFPYFHKFSQLELRRREEIMKSWSSSYIYLLRQLFVGVKFIVMLAHFTQLDENNENPTWKAIGYCGPDPDHVDRVKQSNESEQAQVDGLGPLHRTLVHLDSPIETLSKALAQARLSITSRPNPLPTIRCDVVVVGSGSGGGVVAGVLAQAGYKVVVLEKGHYHARNKLSLIEGPSLDQMYERNGLLATADMGVTILAGSTVGGGSAINWSASIRTPDKVMGEWREKLGLELFGSEAYEHALDVVCKRMGVHPDVEEESLNNAVLRRGCKELGYPVKNIPRNAPSDHHCGWCCFGCKDGRKKGTLETWLVDMVESGNGVIIPGSKAIRVIYENRGREKKVATGVVFEFENGWSGEKEKCMVEAKVTVVACGALNTPVLLKKSGLRNKNIGKHLHLHPVVMGWGYFPEKEARWDVDKNSYEGAIMTAMHTVVRDGYGAIIQTPSLHPGLFSVVTPWLSGEDFKWRMTRFARTAHLFTLARDRGEGEVDESGSIRYRMDGHDERNLKKGVEKMMRIIAAAGATEIGTVHKEGEKLDLRTASSHEFERFVRRMGRKRVTGLRTPVCSAHQMGSCRMGVRPETSAVDPKGETWEVQGLYVADTSVFPTALGVNPMVTVQAIAYCTALSVAEVLRRKVK